VNNGAVAHGQAVEEKNAHSQGHLLVGNRGYDALEYGGKPRWLHSAEALCQWTERGIAAGEGIKCRQVGAKSEESFQDRRHGLL